MQTHAVATTMMQSAIVARAGVVGCVAVVGMIAMVTMFAVAAIGNAGVHSTATRNLAERNRDALGSCSAGGR